LEVQVLGNICQFGSKDKASVKYTYDDKNRLIKEEQNGISQIRTYYVGDTHLISKKFIVSKDKILEREFYEYDKNAILTKSIRDDGSKLASDDLTDVSYRLITEIEPQLNQDLFGLTLPHISREWYVDLKTGKKHLLSKIEYIYTKGNLIAEEKIFDANEVYRFSKHFEYNKRFQLIKEINGLGEVTIYEYNDSGNKIFSEKIGSGKKSRYIFNLADQLIEEIEEHDQGIILRKTYEYDQMGNRISATDIFGQKTRYDFDIMSREIGLTDFEGRKEFYEYDAFDNVISTQDKDGYVTKKTYSLLKKPTEICYPDNSRETFGYNLQGHLIQETKRNGIRIEYTVDYKGRIVEEKHYSKHNEFLRSRACTYKGKNLIAEMDFLGYVSTHDYDGAGRRIATTKEGITTYFEYDSLGRLYKTITDDCVSIKEHDYLDRAIEERIEDRSGNIYSKTEFQYDVLGNQTLVRKFHDSKHVEELKTIYNSLSLPIKQIDAFGNEYNYRYTYSNLLKKETIDPLSRVSVEFHDSMGRLKTQQKWSRSKDLISQSHFKYDGRGNLILSNHDVIYEGKIIDNYTVKTSFDSMNQKIEETENEAKTTKWSYKQSNLSSITNPDGTVLTYAYDSLNRIRELTSTDGTINYRYTYDLGDRLISVHDRVQNTVNERKYDSHSRIIHEVLGNGLDITYEYDSNNRCVKMNFCDGSISRFYSPTSLIKVIRVKNNNALYTFSQECNWLGKPISVHMPHTNVALQWSLNGQCASIHSASYEQQLAYNEVGKVTNITIKDLEGTFQTLYRYDDLDQLTSEKGLYSWDYSFDSLNNRRKLNGHQLYLSNLNQVLNDASDKYVYDLNGRRKSKGAAKYSYDALGRLTHFNKENVSIRYVYDSFGRRIKAISSNVITNYLYHLDIEIGSYQNELTEFRLLDDNHETIAIELNGEIFSPITNHRGDIVQLLGRDGIKANYRYEAFGKYRFSGTINSPWLLFGQRYNCANELYHFCRREYDPNLGVWITPDPAGFLDGPNLYAYVHNNPLTYIDPYGLWWVETKDWCKGVTRGAVDDFSWGASELALGEFHSESGWGTAGYYTDAAASMGAGLLTGSTEAKIFKEVVTLAGKGVAKGCRALKTIKATTNVTDVAKNIPVKQILNPATTNTIKNTTEAAVKSRRPVTPNQLKEYLANVNSFSREKIIADAEKFGLKIKGTSKFGHVNLIDKTGKTRLKIHPPDDDTLYHHIHLYNKKGKSLDSNLQVVRPNSSNAHIEYGGLK
jgi:RHS repeat-associated protein